MGDLGLEAGEGRAYEVYLEGRVLELGMKAGRKGLEEQWKRIRRGWYLGREGFGERMLRLVKGRIAKGRAGSYMGPAKREHGQAEAKRLLEWGLGALGLEAGRLAQKPKAMAEKQVLAWWLRQRTTASRRWLSEQLAMGEESSVSKATGRVKQGGDAELNRLKKHLFRALKNDNGG
jgi:hypothetical protein